MKNFIAYFTKIAIGVLFNILFKSSMKKIQLTNSQILFVKNICLSSELV